MLAPSDNAVNTPDLLAELDDDQTAAVLTDAPRVLCLAAAGAGKTRVLTTRIAHLVQERGVPAERILAITFTVRATDEMRGRLWPLLDIEAAAVQVHTFHGWAAAVIRRHSEMLGLSPQFTIIDEEDREVLVRRVACDLGIKHAATAKVSKLLEDERVPRFLAREMVRRDVVDYDGLEAGLLRLLAEPVVREDLAQVEHVLVDEYQDTSEIQARILAALDPPNLFMVGSPDQAIYAFRGARPENLDEVAADGRTLVLRLGTNYRSGEAIVDLANRIASHGPNLLGDVGYARSEPCDISCQLYPDVETQAVAVAQDIQYGVQDWGQDPGEWLVLARTWLELEPIRHRLAEHGIPAALGRLNDDTDVWSTATARDVVAGLRVLHNESDTLALWRIASHRAYGIAAVDFARVELDAPAGADLDVVSRLLTLESDGAGRLARDLSELRQDLWGPGVDLPEMVHRWLTGLRCVSTAAGHALLAEVEGWCGMAPDPSLAAFLAWYPQRRAQEARDITGAVRLMTIHGAKGLEAPHVHLVGLDAGFFPLPVADGTFDDEERRLFYVAATRARDDLHVHAVERRASWGGRVQQAGPSTFFAWAARCSTQRALPEDDAVLPERPGYGCGCGFFCNDCIQTEDCRCAGRCQRAQGDD